MNPAVERCRESIQKHSKSFALASRLLPKALQNDAVVLYAYCRHVDDAIDLVPAAEQPLALERLRAELDAVYAGRPVTEPILVAFQELVQQKKLPREYPEELLSGMEMDVLDTQYRELDELLLYCYRVAGVVGLMMCHVLGVSSPVAMRHGGQLGIAMQLTNICRDITEDAERGRLYIPEAILRRHGGGVISPANARTWSALQRQAIAAASMDLLDLAERYYTSGDCGVKYLAAPAACAVMLARLSYSDIGRVLRARHCDPTKPRAYVSTPRKAFLASVALTRVRHLPRTITPVALETPMTAADIIALDL